MTAMTAGWPRHIVIAGGGTAGWLAAMMLGGSAKRGGHACEVTVIGTSKIGNIAGNIAEIVAS